MKKNNYSYIRKGGLVSIIVTDERGIHIDTFKYNRGDKKLEKAIAQILFSKHGIDLTPSAPSLDELKREAGFFDT